jgi:NADH:quinone reductase (non-electrogenic)
MGHSPKDGTQLAADAARPAGPSGPSAGRRPRVLVLGGGFGGIGAARKLKGTDADVVLVDRHDYHTFQPLLYQLATDLLETDAVGHPLRDLFHEQPNITVHQATATSIDLEAREVTFDEIAPIEYDYLVLGLGAEVNFFGTTGAGEHAFPMYTLADAVRLKNHIIAKWEAADRDPDIVDDGALNVVVVGGGPTGVESAGALGELYRSVFAKDFPGIPQDNVHVTLVEAGPELFTMFKPNLRAYAKEALGKRGVDVLVGEMVEAITPTRVTLKSGKVLKAHTLIWGAGLQAQRLAGSLDVELQRGNRVPVGPDLTVEGHPEVFAIGDVAWITDTKTDRVLPQLGSVALQAGEQAGENIARRIAGEDTKPFEYHDKGTMATIGRGAAVIQFHRGRTMKGTTAFLAWGTVHLALLSTGEDRAKALVNWTWSGFSHERPGRISVDTTERPETARQAEEATR